MPIGVAAKFSVPSYLRQYSTVELALETARDFRLEKCFWMSLSGEYLFRQGKDPSSILV